MQKQDSKAPQCPSCTYNIPQAITIAGEFMVKLYCRKQVVMYPNATNCRDHEREPGAD